MRVCAFLTMNSQLMEPGCCCRAIERRLIRALRQRGRELGDSSVTSAIFQGLITSADHVYHLERTAPNRYRRKINDEWEEHEIEDAVMRPLVSGETKRYISPNTNKYILFPYDDAELPPKLISVTDFEKKYNHAWQYLQAQGRASTQREFRI